jgi:hypothetical protein
MGTIHPLKTMWIWVLRGCQRRGCALATALRFTYALAREKREPVLWKGDDFGHTDLPGGGDPDPKRETLDPPRFMGGNGQAARSSR